MDFTHAALFRARGRPDSASVDSNKLQFRFKSHRRNSLKSIALQAQHP